MGATKLIEEAEMLCAVASAAKSGAVSLAGVLYEQDRDFIVGARTLVPELAAALKASEERATAAELDAASLRAAWKIADRTLLTAECQAHAKTSFDLLGVVKERDDLAAANLAANKRIVELEHERDAARAELARLTTPRPIADAPRDGRDVLVLWIERDIDPNVTPEVMHWDDDCAKWMRGAESEIWEQQPTHYVPLPDVKP